MISAGEEWEDVIDENLENANIIIALISSDFIDSEYCYGRELARARERHNAGEAIVIPVIVRPVDWHGLWIEDLQMLPEDAKAVTELRCPPKTGPEIMRVLPGKKPTGGQHAQEPVQ
jgi:hypothetical protein